MSWLARSIANTLRLDDDEGHQNDVVDNDDDDGIIKPPQQNNAPEIHAANLLHPSKSLDYLEEVDLEDSDEKFIQEENNYNFEKNGDQNNNQGRGVKEDLSEFTETLTRQLWGVASFLAPPPPPPPPPPAPRQKSFSWLETDRRSEVVQGPPSGDEESNEEEYETEGGQFPEFSQNFYQMGTPEAQEEQDVLADAVGITEEALDFAENIAHHPETWLNFPLSEEEEFDDFEISDSQHQHARAIEHLAPRLAALRRELCPAHMTEGYFWMVYFVLLHSRLNKHDDDLLSTPQLVKARAMWMHELQKLTKPEPDWLGRHTFDSEDNIYFAYENLDPTSYEDTHPKYESHVVFPLESTASLVTTDSEPDKHPHERREIQFMDKSLSEENPISKTGKELLIGPSHKVPFLEYDEHEDDWLDDDSDLEGYTGAVITLVNEEDVSFSDLEDDIDCTMPITSKLVTKD